MKKNLHYSPIGEIAELIRLKKVSPVEIVKGCLARIKHLNRKLHAFITVLENEVLKEAEIAEAEIRQGHWKGYLHGIPVAVKDFYDTAGIRTTAASEHFKDRVPKKDAAIVTKLKESGAIIIGKTNMHELGMGTTSLVSYFGKVHNPWNNNYVAGGSSGGSAVAVATGMCYATVDTDAVGSCRLPASCCGVTGFKVSNGLISMQGILEGEKADDTIVQFAATGITTRSIKDTAILLNELSMRGITEKDTANSTLRIGVVQNFNGTEAVKKVFYEAVKVIESFGYATNPIEVPFEKASFNIKNIAVDRAQIPKQLFKEVDVLLLPAVTASTPGMKEAESKGPLAVASDNTFFCNYFGLPAVSVPAGFDSNGLPIGLQMAGALHGEANICNLARQFEETSSFHSQHPVV